VGASSTALRLCSHPSESLRAWPRRGLRYLRRRSETPRARRCSVLCRRCRVQRVLDSPAASAGTLETCPAERQADKRLAPPTYAHGAPRSSPPVSEIYMWCVPPSASAGCGRLPAQRTQQRSVIAPAQASGAVRITRRCVRRALALRVAPVRSAGHRAHCLTIAWAAAARAPQRPTPRDETGLWEPGFAPRRRPPPAHELGEVEETECCLFLSGETIQSTWLGRAAQFNTRT
jgi:hypothetical protein